MAITSSFRCFFNDIHNGINKLDALHVSTVDLTCEDGYFDLMVRDKMYNIVVGIIFKIPNNLSVVLKLNHVTI